MAKQIVFGCFATIVLIVAFMPCSTCSPNFFGFIGKAVKQVSDGVGSVVTVIDKDVISPAVSAIDKEVFKPVFKTEILKHALTPVREISGVANTVVNAIDKEVMEPVLGTEILGSVLRIVPGTAYVMNMSPSSKKPKPGDNPDGSFWMRNVSDKIKINQMSIPGTHDTMACDVTYPPAVRKFTQCQDMTLQEQLSAGVRLLDIRLRHFRNSFPIHHGPIFLNTNFAEVLKTVVDFLQRNPSEAIFMSYQKEHEDAENTKDFNQVFDEHIERYNKYYIHRNYDNIGTTMLKDIRGKIVFINFSNHGPIGYKEEEFIAENKYKGVTGTGLDWFRDNIVKASYLERLKKNIRSSQDDKTGINSYITYCSASDITVAGSLAMVGPREIANEVNPAMHSFLRGSREGRGGFGMVMFDFPSSGLIASVYKNNPRITGSSCFVNSWDADQFCLCKSGERISQFNSAHRNYFEDRQWDLKCQRIPNYIHTQVKESESNEWDGDFNWNNGIRIENKNQFLVGLKSHHSNRKEDRIYTALYTSSEHWKLTECSGWKSVNSWDEPIKVSLAHNEVIAALFSNHNNYREDRQWKIRTCTLVEVLESPQSTPQQRIRRILRSRKKPPPGWVL